MTLTEQWKKGELESGWYYVKEADGLFGMMSDYALYRVNLEHPDNEITLLAKVPSYEEWKAAYECQLMESELVLTLKELLKECLDEIHELAEIQDDRSVTIYNFLSAELVTKITTAIGEK